MPRTNLPLTQITRDGVAPGAEVNADTANNHQGVNDGRVFLLVRNAGAGAQNVTLLTPGTVEGLAIADVVVSVPAGASRYIGPFPPATFGDPLQVDVASADLRLTAYRI